MSRIIKPVFAEVGDAELLPETGKALYGRRFEALLGKELSVPPGFLSETINGKKPLPQKHRATLACLCHRWLMQLAEKRASMESIEREWRDACGQSGLWSVIKSEQEKVW